MNKKQRMIVLSMVKIKYISTTHYCSQLFWIKVNLWVSRFMRLIFLFYMIIMV